MCNRLCVACLGRFSPRYERRADPQPHGGGEPEAVFLHFWGKGTAESLAKGFKAALEAQAGRAAIAPAASVRFAFDGAAAGALPAGWKAQGTNQRGPVATWRVEQDAAAPSAPNTLTLASIDHDSDSTFNLCWTSAVLFTDGAAEVKFRANTGEVDQGGGLIWRVKDQDSYMLARMNPLEDNLRLYTVKGGRRTQLASATVKAASGVWHTLRIEHRGNAVRCLLNGAALIDITDAGIAASGGVGVWTKADAATSFDDLVVTPQ